jgi:hypothetical protein
LQQRVSSFFLRHENIFLIVFEDRELVSKADVQLIDLTEEDESNHYMTQVAISWILVAMCGNRKFPNFIFKRMVSRTSLQKLNNDIYGSASRWHP